MNEGDKVEGGRQKDSPPVLELAASFMGLCAKGLSTQLPFGLCIVAGSMSSERQPNPSKKNINKKEIKSKGVNNYN